MSLLEDLVVQGAALTGAALAVVPSHSVPASPQTGARSAYATFTNPTDIRPLVKSLTTTPTTPGFDVTADNVPSTGLATDDVKQRVKELAVPFFGEALRRVEDEHDDEEEGDEEEDGDDGD